MEVNWSQATHTSYPTVQTGTAYTSLLDTMSYWPPEGAGLWCPPGPVSSERWRTPRASRSPRSGPAGPWWKRRICSLVPGPAGSKRSSTPPSEWSSWATTTWLLPGTSWRRLSWRTYSGLILCRGGGEELMRQSHKKPHKKQTAEHIFKDEKS